MAEVLISGTRFDETLAFFTDQLGFRLQLITPADDPALAVLEGRGLTLRIDRDRETVPVTLVVEGDGPPIEAPNGTTIEFAPPPAMALPDLVPDLVVAHETATDAWVAGRAGMRYRDLLPSRLGGRFIASHIEVCDGGPVADLVHHHDIRFQMIFCHWGWVDVVYQDQGPPFRLEAGDAVLQPSGIRHKVLASSAGARVVEIGCPAQHDTLFDHDLTLPTAEVDLDRRYNGQRFVRHVAAEAPWSPAALTGFEVQETAIAEASDGLAGARILRPCSERDLAAQPQANAAAEFHFLFVLEGEAELALDEVIPLGVGSAVSLLPGQAYGVRPDGADLRLLEVTLPAVATPSTEATAHS